MLGLIHRSPHTIVEDGQRYDVLQRQRPLGVVHPAVINDQEIALVTTGLQNVVWRLAGDEFWCNGKVIPLDYRVIGHEETALRWEVKIYHGQGKVQGCLEYELRSAGKKPHIVNPLGVVPLYKENARFFMTPRDGTCEDVYIYQHQNKLEGVYLANPVARQLRVHHAEKVASYENKNDNGLSQFVTQLQQKKDDDLQATFTLSDYRAAERLLRYFMKPPTLHRLSVA